MMSSWKAFMLSCYHLFGVKLKSEKAPDLPGILVFCFTERQGRLDGGGGYKAEPCEILALKRHKARIWDFQPYKAEIFFRPALRLGNKRGFFSFLPFFLVIFSWFMSLEKFHNRMQKSYLSRAAY